MNILKIGAIGKTNTNNVSNGVSTNPFASANFRGNVLPFGDVFVGATKKVGLGEKIQNKMKMISGSVLGNVSDLGKRVYEPVKSFAGRIREDLVMAWDKTVGKTLEIKDVIAEKANALFKGKDYVAENTPVPELRKMFEQELENMGGLSV